MEVEEGGWGKTEQRAAERWRVRMEIGRKGQKREREGKGAEGGEEEKGGGGGPIAKQNSEQRKDGV